MLRPMLLRSYNRRAFGSVVRYSFSAEPADPMPLIALYGALVRLELALKDHDPKFLGMGHDVCRMLTELSVTPALVTQLTNRLEVLWCTMKTGSEGHVLASKYPDLRYLHHETDFPGKSTNAELMRALDVLRDIERELRAKGIKP